MTKFGFAILGLLALAPMAWGQSCPAGSLSTGSLAGTTVPTSTLTNWGQPNPPGVTLTVPQFNPATGTLTSAVVSATGTASGSATGTNNGGRAADFTITLSASVLVTGPSGTANLNPLPATSQTFTGVAPTGTGTISGQTGSNTVFESVTSGLANYIGPGTVAFGASALGTSSTSVTSGTVSTVYDTSAGASIAVIYCYPPPTLSITKLPATNTLIQTNTGLFTLTVSNAASTSPTTAAVTVTDPVPAGLTVTGTPSGTGWNCAGTTGQSVSCTRSDALQPGASYPAITVNYTVAPGTTAGTLTNTATVTGGGDPTAPHTASANVTIPPPTLSITKLPLTNTVAENGTGFFTLTVSNAAGGGYTTAAVTVTDPVPTGLTVTGTPGGTGWNCAATAGQSVSCTRSDFLAPGGSFPAITVNYTASATAALGSPYTNTATVTGGGDPTAPHTASAQVIVPSPSPLLSITKLPLTNTVIQNGTGSFTLTVSDAVAATTAAVTVTDPYLSG